VLAASLVRLGTEEAFGMIIGAAMWG
jgi:hypothetical protein